MSDDVKMKLSEVDLLKLKLMQEKFTRVDLEIRVTEMELQRKYTEKEAVLNEQRDLGELLKKTYNFGAGDSVSSETGEIKRGPQLAQPAPDTLPKKD